MKKSKDEYIYTINEYQQEENNKKIGIVYKRILTIKTIIIKKISYYIHQETKKTKNIISISKDSIKSLSPYEII